MREVVENFIRERQIGDILITLPSPPEDISHIANYDLPKEEQYFRRTHTPTDKEFASWDKDKQDDFVFAEFKKRKFGYWFFNNGNLEYITGIHYFYTNYWYTDAGYPEFRDLDRDFFYFWDYCVQDDNSLGMCYIAKRREGKTNKFCAILYEATTLRKMVRTGLQSKTNKDAKRIFKFIIAGWKRLPAFFKPTDSGDTNPQTSLRFEEPSGRGKVEKVYKDVLDSSIDYESTVDTAYDGQKLFRYGLDEFGKNKELKVSELWDIVKFCLTTGIDGKALLTTTVEEMDRSGGREAKIIWDNSGFLEKGEYDTTKTGLYRLFFPAYYGLEFDKNHKFIDKYGYSQVDEAKEFLEQQRARLSGDSLASFRRKYPFTPQECFRIDKDAEFDVARIYDQMDHNSENPSKLVRGNFVWEVQYEKVKFQENQNGRWLIYKLPPVELRNNVKFINGRLAPANQNLYVCGADPFDSNRTYSGKQSMGASFTWRYFDGMDKKETNIFIAQYIARPPKSELYYEDMLMQCIFYGMQILCENNKPGLINYFLRLGFQNYLMKRPEFSVGSSRLEYGIPMSGEASRETLIRCLQSWIYDWVGLNKELDQDNNVVDEWWGNCPFDDLLNDLVDFDVEDWTPFDASVAAGLALIAANKNLIKKKVEKKPFHLNVKTFSNRGIVSKRIFPKG